MLSCAKRNFKQITFFCAKTSAQHENGLAESNYSVAKKILVSLTGHLQKTNLLFQSAFQLSSTFCKIAAQLNERPICYDENCLVTVKDLLYPCVDTEEGKCSIKTLIESHDSAFESFQEAFTKHISLGHFQRFGRVATRAQHKLKVNDFCLILYPSQNKVRYGLVSSLKTNHCVEMKLLQKRIGGKGKKVIEQFAAENIVFLHRTV